MNVKIHITEFGTPEFDEILQLRNEILRVPLGLQFFVKDISKEYDEFHLAARDESYQLLGYLSLKQTGEKKVKMRQVVVADKLQGKGIGKKMVEYSEIFARMKGHNFMELHARRYAVPFYLKLGYKKVGKIFYEVNIPHYKMIKPLIKEPLVK